MESPDRVNRAGLFRRELSAFPKDVALELEDHLAEALEIQLALGKEMPEAKTLALQTLGDLGELARELHQVPHDPLWGRARLPWPLRVLILGWLAFGLVCLSRICAEESPTYLTIGASLAFGLTGSAVGLGLLRRRELLRRWACRLSAGMGLLLVIKSLLATAAPPMLPIAPALMPVLAAAALLSAWFLARPEIRKSFL